MRPADILPGDRFDGPGGYTILPGTAVSTGDLVRFRVQHDDGGIDYRYWLPTADVPLTRPRSDDGPEPTELETVRRLQAETDVRVDALRHHVLVTQSVKALPGTETPATVDAGHLENLREAWQYGAEQDVIVARVRDLLQ